MSSLIWIQTVWHCDGIPERYFWKVKKKNPQTTKSMQNYSACKKLILHQNISFHQSCLGNTEHPGQGTFWYKNKNKKKVWNYPPVVIFSGPKDLELEKVLSFQWNWQVFRVSGYFRNNTTNVLLFFFSFLSFTFPWKYKLEIWLERKICLNFPHTVFTLSIGTPYHFTIHVRKFEKVSYCLLIGVK